MSDDIVDDQAPQARRPVKDLINALIDNIKTVLFGKDEKIRLALTALFAGGHLLVEDVPGTGKTVLAKAIAGSFNADFQRVQFTPDLLPSDLTGVSIFNPKELSFEFRKGPLFTDLLLADEINRATPRAQSALLECMEESQITVNGQSYQLPPSFFVMATQNPIEHQGTFPLPEAQLDRFALCINFGYPAPSEMTRILAAQRKEQPIKSLCPVLDIEDLKTIQSACRDVTMDPEIEHYLIEIALATRRHEAIALGASTRAIICFAAISRAHALIHHRGYVIPDDVKACAQPVLLHRLLLDHKARLIGSDSRNVLQDILQQIPAPVLPDPQSSPPGP
jgi:MoxR-like ATPase